MNLPKLADARLQSAVPFVRPGKVVADIGTDHAYLPIFLVQSGITPRAIAADINKGPIQSAQRHIREACLQDRIQTLQTDGLHGVEAFAPEEILIFGMGGELIVKILSEAPWVKNPAVGLILQPMSKAEVLREWLNREGFSVCGEALSVEDQCYQTLRAVWCGKSEDYTPAEYLVGKDTLAGKSPYSERLLRQKIHIYEDILKGKRQAQTSDCTKEEALLSELRQALERLHHFQTGGTIE